LNEHKNDSLVFSSSVAVSTVQHIGHTTGIQVLDPPDSCYEDGDRQISKKFTVGCADKFIDVITSNIKVIGGVAIGFAVVEVSTFV
jgi:hypothetical protein